jgi:hypothetical protein
MVIDLFKDLIVPVIGGLGIFMLGLLFMEEGIVLRMASRRILSIMVCWNTPPSMQKVQMANSKCQPYATSP